MDRKELGKRLRAIRKQKGLSQSQLADLMGYKDHSTLAKVETGVNDITIETLYKYSSILGVDVVDILNESRRILVIGCAGSGKSYFSKKLSKLLNIERIHIDNLFWNEDKTHISREELIKKYDDVFKKDSFILDGNFSHTLEYRLGYVDTVYFFDFSKDDCLKGVRKRVGKRRDDSPWVESQEDPKELIEHINIFDKEDKPLIVEALSKHKNITIYKFTNREEVNRYLKSFE